MKKAKRIIALVLALTMALSLCGCKKKKKEKEQVVAQPVATAMPNDPFEVKLNKDKSKQAPH